MLTSRQKQMLQEIPKAENHIHIEGSIPWALALELAEKNHEAASPLHGRNCGLVSGSNLQKGTGWVYDL